MPSHILPLVLVVGILAVTGVTVVVAAFLKERKTLAGYEEIESDVAMLKAKLGGEIFRDGVDLVIAGEEQKVPVVIRFSYSEDTPGMNIRIHGPATMNLAVIPKGSQFIFPDNLRLNVNTPDDMFNARFITRADDGSAARMFLMSRVTMKEMQKALCSSRTTLSITHGALELTETTVPQPYTGRHVSGHIESLLKLSTVLAKMPGAQLSVVEKPKLPKRILTRTAVAFGAIAALLSIVGAAEQLKEPPQIKQAADVLSVDERGAGVEALDQKVVTELESYRVVKPSEMDAGVVDWIRSRGLEPSGRVALDLAGTGSPDDVAYLLTTPDGRRRIVMISNKKVVFDGRGFGPVSIMRVKRDNMPPIPGTGGQPPTPAHGDGVLMVLDQQTPDKAFLLYLTPAGSIVNQAAPNWLQLDIRQ